MLGAVVGPLHVTTHRPTSASMVQLDMSARHIGICSNCRCCRLSRRTLNPYSAILH